MSKIPVMTVDCELAYWQYSDRESTCNVIITRLQGGRGVQVELMLSLRKCRGWGVRAVLMLSLLFQCRGVGGSEIPDIELT